MRDVSIEPLWQYLSRIVNLAKGDFSYLNECKAVFWLEDELYADLVELRWQCFRVFRKYEFTYILLDFILPALNF